MLYLKYESMKRKCSDAQKVYDSILTEKEELFQKTQPQAVDTTKEKVSSCPEGTSYDRYIIEKERKRIDDRLEVAKENFQERLTLLRQVEAELRESRELEDMIYTLRHLDRLKIKKIATFTNYSEAHVNRKLKIIRRKIKDDRK